MTSDCIVSREALKRTEEHLKEVLAWREAIIEGSRDALFISDENSRFRLVNQAACDLTGYSRQELLEMCIPDLHKPSDLKAYAKYHDSIMAGHDAVTESKLKRKNGSTVDVEISNRRIMIGDTSYMHSVARDVSERKRVEEAHRESERRFREFIEQDLAGYFIGTPEGKLIYCNSSFAHIFGYESVDDAMKQNLVKVHRDGEARRKLVERVSQERRLENTEIELRSIDGRPIHIVQNVIGIFDENDELKEIRGYIFDITSRKRLEEQLHQSQKLEAVGQLAGGIAHDFNNVLTVITGHAQIMESLVGEDSPLQEDIAELQMAANRAATLTRQLLAFSRRQVLEPRVVNLNTLVAGTEKLLRRVIGENIKLITAFEEQLGNVKVDPGQLENVILNLAINARDAMPDKGELIIETANTYLDQGYSATHELILPGHYVMVAVSDTGMGMDEETRARVFEPFFTTKEKDKGTGLGLSTVYGIVKQSDGYIWNYTELGKGTVFKVYLPRVDRPEEPLDVRGTPAEIQGGSERILVVEDDGAVLDVTYRILQGAGYRVMVACNGTEALERYGSEPIDLLLTDVVMPQMSGPELVEQVMSIRQGTRVLYVSGYPEKAIVHHGVSNVFFLPKPFSKAGLLQKVRSVLDMRCSDAQLNSKRFSSL